MSEISRVYDSSDKAQRVARDLRRLFLDDAVSVTNSASRPHLWVVRVMAPFGMSGMAIEILEEFGPIMAPSGEIAAESGNRPTERVRDPGLEAIHRLSQKPPLGAIPRLSRAVSPGAVGRLSGYKSPGAISRLSRYKSPGAVARLSGYKSPGAISRLSRYKPPGAISSMSSGWYFSKLFGLPLLTQSQAPMEPDAALLTDSHRTTRRAPGR